MAYMVMAYIVMAYIVMAYMVMAYIYSYGRYSYGLYSHGRLRGDQSRLQLELLLCEEVLGALQLARGLLRRVLLPRAARLHVGELEAGGRRRRLGRVQRLAKLGNFRLAAPRLDLAWAITTYRHCRQRVHCAGMGVPVLKMTAFPRRSF